MNLFVKILVAVALAVGLGFLVNMIKNRLDS